MDEFSILITFTGGLAVALVFGYLAHRLKLSPIIGYLLAGVVVGPFTPGFVAKIAAAQYNKFQLRSSALERHKLRGQGSLTHKAAFPMLHHIKRKFLSMHSIIESVDALTPGRKHCTWSLDV